MNENEFREFVAKQKWTFSKRYAAFAPHEYALRGNDDAFVDAARYIREAGMRMFYYKTERMYLFLDGYFYWTMDEKLEKTTLINRCKPEDYDIVFMKRGTQKK